MCRIQAKILNVVAERNFAINAGKNKGVTKHIKFKVLRGKNPLAIVEVIEVYDTFCLAELCQSTDTESYKINVGDDVIQLPETKGGKEYFWVRHL